MSSREVPSPLFIPLFITESIVYRARRVEDSATFAEESPNRSQRDKAVNVPEAVWTQECCPTGSRRGLLLRMAKHWVEHVVDTRIRERQSRDRME